MGPAGTAAANEETIRAWNGVLFDRFLQFRDILTTGLGAHGEAALAWRGPAAGDRVVDLGCGFGDTTQRLAGMVGPAGHVLGVDVAERFIELARAESAANNVEFMVADVQTTRFTRTFDYAFSRFGTMFFANPVVALRNVREALAPGGRLCSVVWRRKLDNEWMHRAERVVEEYVTEPDETDEPTCGPGPFSMAGADTTTDILRGAGFEDITLRRCDMEIRIGRDLDQAVQLMMALGPAGEVIRLAGEAAERVRPEIERALRDALAEFAGPDGVRAAASTWLIHARAPAS